MSENTIFAEATGIGNIVVNFRGQRVIYSGETQYQKIDIVDTDEFGRMLFLDRTAQSSQRDMFVYHEALTHPAMLTHPKPEKVCVIGGGEGATLWEVYRHPDVRRAVMVDIDEEVVRLCREYLPEWNRGSFDDPRTDLHIGDGRAFLEQTEEKFDVILVDLSDPLREGPAVFLFTQEFYQVIYDHLTPQGTVCFQGETLQPWRVQLHARMYNTLKKVFPVVVSYPYSQPCFHEIHGFVMASKDQDPRKEDLGSRAMERGMDFRYLSPKYLNTMFTVPGYVERAYEEFSQPLTDAEPGVLRDKLK